MNQQEQRNLARNGEGETNWIKTNPGKGFFMYFRFYGPLEPFYDKSWKINDVVKVA